MIKQPSRRSFLRSAHLAAACLPMSKTMFAETSQTGSPAPFQVFTAGKQSAAVKALTAKPGNDGLFTSPTLTVAMTVENTKAAKEFEWHERRDHILQVINGATLYEVGGAPLNGRATKPGEWLAPASPGATKLTLSRGDMLVIPRGTPHRRTTETSVTFLLISAQGAE